jgi:riboflavin kinase/FMN adenylyltransferase
MIIYRCFSEITAPLVNPVVTIGNFDGVHLGHREIFRRLKQSARELGGVSVVITFDPHPLRVVNSHRDVTLINTLDEKITLIEASGVDYLIIIPFDISFAATPSAEFIEKYLVGIIGTKKLIIGYDYAFGRNREGNFAMLSSFGSRFGFDVEELAPINCGETIYSSSLIRRMIAAGEVADIVRFLGRHFSLGGRVVHGANRGKTLGFPTANIATDKELIPGEGVYAVKVKINDRLYDGACNIGTNPTFDGTELSIEAFIFDFVGELYDQELRVYFIERLRGEIKFSSVEELKEAIAADVAACRRILATTPLVTYSEYLEEL